jgi:hypothetical protein
MVGWVSSLILKVELKRKKVEREKKEEEIRGRRSMRRKKAPKFCGTLTPLGVGCGGALWA